MILIVGGLASGKRAFVRSLGFTDADMSGNVSDALPVLTDAQELVRAADVDEETLAERIAACKRVVLCRDVGNGIVPADAAERAWRERAGRLAQLLAARADAVVRMTCGIPQAVKGPLPVTQTELVIMRHGTTEANERREYAGVTDVALTERGEREARAAGVCPHVRDVYVSPLSRARRTAEICFPNARQIAVDGLRELDFGVFEGRRADDMADDEAFRTWVEGMCEGRCPGGEQRSELIARVSEALIGIVRDALVRGERRVVIVGHGGTIMAALDAFGTSERDYFDWQVGNCEGYRATATFQNGELVLNDEQRFADLSFMQDDATAGPSASSDGHPTPGSTFFANTACEYFPCHEGIDPQDFNCLFCYCPLYMLGPDCGGNFTYTESGRKSCKGCPLPHRGTAGSDLIAANYARIASIAGRIAGDTGGLH